MNEKLRKLQAQREKLAADIRAMAEKGKTESLDEEGWDKLNAEYDACKVDLDAEVVTYEAEQKRQQAIEARLADLTKHDNDQGNLRLLGRDNAKIGEPADLTPQGKPSDKANQLMLGLQAWLGAGSQETAQHVTDEQRQAAAACGFNLASNDAVIPILDTYRVRKIQNVLSTQDGSTGGFLMPNETFVNRLELAMLSFGGMFQVSEIIRTPTAVAMHWPAADDTSNTGIQVGESVSVDASVEPTFSQVIWNAYKYSSQMVKVPHELLRDAPFSLENLHGEMLGERLGRIQNTKFTTGSGASTPKGITVGLTTGKTTASSTAITFDELMDLEHSIDPSRRSNGCSFMFHDNVLKLLRKLKDGDGQYIWQRGTTGGAPDTILTYPLTINQDMSSAITTTLTTVIFGQLAHYKIRQVESIRLLRLVERYAELDQVAFVAFIEADGNLLTAGDDPVKALVQV